MDVILQDLDPRETFSKWFKANPSKRPDGRALNDIPDLSFQLDIVSSAEGSALVKFGETVVVASIKTEVSEPDLSAPEEGFLVINFHLAAGARYDVKPGPPVEEVQEITDNLSKTIKGNGVIDPKSLCIVPGQLVRVVYLDAVCLNDSGNSFDTALLACILALKNAKMFIPELDEHAGMVYINDKDSRQSLDLQCWPVSIHYGLFDSSTFLLFPSTKEIAACSSAQLRVIFDLVSGKVLGIEKSSALLTDASLLNLTQPAMSLLSSKLQNILQ